MIKADAVLTISFPVSGEQVTIKSNIKPERIQEVLEDYVRSQMGSGEQSDRNYNAKEIYTITLGLDLSDDTFTTSSDTGNEVLTLGIVMDVLKNFGSVKIES